MSSDVSDLEPLTPAHLLYGHRIVPLPYATTDGSKLMTLPIAKPLQPACKPGLFNMLKCYNTSNTVGDDNI